MDSSKIKDSIITIVADVLQIDASKIKESDSPETIDKWTSLFHVMIIDKIEKQFNVSFDFDELIEIDSVKDLCESLENKL